jgi:hypothetical protein
MTQLPILDRLKPLTTDQYDAARRKALERVRARIGECPQRNNGTA